MLELKNLTIVIPAYQEEFRLPETLQGLQNFKSTQGLQLVRIFVCDDGSQDGTAQVVESWQMKLPSLRLLKAPSNEGKGAAIRRGVLSSLREGISEWILIADADMATPWEEVDKLFLAALNERREFAIGSRSIRGSQIRVRQNPIRELLGKTFNRLVKILSGLPHQDTQCGFKLISTSALRTWIHETRVDRFAWDVEYLILARSHGFLAVEVPVRWEHREGSKISILRDGLEMVWRVVMIRLRSWFL
jgi:glycosyltransferase involved in cell wall biosynthesis